jgi:hypothetical protein
MNLVFHVVLLSGQYENLQALGDRILAAQGTIRIPFYSRDRFFDVVIDGKLKRLYSQPNSHNLQLRCKFYGYLSEFVPFSLAFDQVKGISQKARSKTGLKQSYALSFEPEGVAPNYALMTFLQYAEGEEAGLQATRNLGQFILHVIGNPNIKADLADPGKVGPDKVGRGSGFGDALIALYGATNGRTPLGAGAIQMMADNKARSEMVAQEQQAMAQKQQATWQAMVGRDYSDLLNGSVFESLDKLIAVTP